MLKTFPIDFVRVAIENQLLINKNNNNALFGGKNEMQIFSFYENLKDGDEVDRYVERYQDLSQQQNRSGLIGNGIIASSDSPSITNIVNAFISPFGFMLKVRCTLENRDDMLGTLYELINTLKGKKVDIACFDNGQLLAVQTIGCDYTIDRMSIYNGCFLGEITEIENNETYTDKINALITSIMSSGFIDNNLQNDDIVYLEIDGKLRSFQYKLDTPNYFTEVFNIIPSHNSFTKYKVDFAFDNLNCDQPYILDAQEYMVITLSGSATFVSSNVKLGNDLVRLLVAKDKIITSNNNESDIDLKTNGELVYTYLEPLELPSSTNLNNQINQLRSNFFKQNSHTDGMSNSLQYTFIYDTDIAFLNQLFNYARYGISGITINDISPNMIFRLVECWSSWGNIELISIPTKIAGDIDIENSESDVLTISVNMQIQGENH